ncbi:hypothetical protein EVAR_25578_1 [Eumeta japonica]|uniref:Uncharacterized protein n=1 Tax=Eumeta variegata TaxID=151549 RepID=A0A4C1V2K4_EUMVA|nr:hypothetical protein EVAR_25578_1 [Eumeta japonica]
MLPVSWVGINYLMDGEVGQWNFHSQNENNSEGCYFTSELYESVFIQSDVETETAASSHAARRTRQGVARIRIMDSRKKKKYPSASPHRPAHRSNSKNPPRRSIHESTRARPPGALGGSTAVCRIKRRLVNSSHTKYAQLEPAVAAPPRAASLRRGPEPGGAHARLLRTRRFALKLSHVARDAVTILRFL